jgi:hypothetical protein
MAMKSNPKAPKLPNPPKPPKRPKPGEKVYPKPVQPGKGKGKKVK